jgi:hypothetical protein
VVVAVSRGAAMTWRVGVGEVACCVVSGFPRPTAGEGLLARLGQLVVVRPPVEFAFLDEASPNEGIEVGIQADVIESCSVASWSCALISCPDGRSSGAITNRRPR